MRGMEWLNYHHLRYFWTIAREGSLRQASEALGVSQPSISAQMRLLEEALGERLFRRSGRRLVLTEVGQLALSYAEEIFMTGQELLGAVKHGAGARTMRLRVGITDSIPKLVASRMLQPVFTMEPPVRLTCREGSIDRLLVELAGYRLDIVLADESASRSLQIKTFSHLLGRCGSTFCAVPRLAARLRRGFPRSLHGAPALLPAENTAFRMSLGRWLDSIGVRPHIAAEFEDSALMKAVAAEGHGFTVVPSTIAVDVERRYGLKAIATTEECANQFFAITAERRLKHPAVVAITERLRSDLVIQA